MISDSLAFQILANQERLKCYQKVTDIKVGLFGLEAGKLGPLYYKTHDGAILKSSREFVTVREAQQWLDDQRNFENFSIFDLPTDEI